MKLQTLTPLILLAIGLMTNACNKNQGTTLKDGIKKLGENRMEVVKSFPEINLSIIYRFSIADNDSSEAEVKGNFYFVDKNTNFFMPNSTEYFTIRCDSKSDSTTEYLINGFYDTKKDSLVVTYDKVR